ncbi:FkbM family methyltransferase [Neorhizobium sp. BT27B]|uniref:FkbM family methyltransferase n=1 Tax=Neorhizobium sp. BT27B TaxID=3142625 RepID=UPI003D2C0ACA
MFSRLRAMIRVRALLADLESCRSTVAEQGRQIASHAESLAHVTRLVDEKSSLLEDQATLFVEQARQLTEARQVIQHQASQLAQLDRFGILLAHIEKRVFSPEVLLDISPHIKRNILPNDDAALQKLMMATWAADPKSVLDYADLLASGFRVFSQNDEDGVLLRIFSKIGMTNRYVLEIGSNCSGSDIGIPENLSANLIIHHGWHGVVVELDPVECEKMRYFFSRNLATKHFHMTEGERHSYFSPNILQREVTPDNIDALFAEARAPAEPDLFIIDIDGGDYAVMESLSTVRPRVVVVEFEKRFRERFCVVQPDRANFSRRYPQSGTASLSAWQALMGARGYALTAIATCGFNAFFVRNDLAEGQFAPLSADAAFDQHPLLSTAPDSLWLEPDDTWVEIRHEGRLPTA